MAIVGVMFLAFLATVHVASFQDIENGEIIDLTHPFDNKTLGYPGLKEFELNVYHNGTTKDGDWLQIENYSGGIHVGTNIDAPCHIRKGQWCLDQIPIDRFIAPAAVVSISDRAKKNRDTNLEIQDLINWERTTGKSLNGNIVLVNSGWGKKWRSKKEFFGTDTKDLSKVHFPGVSPEAAEWLAANRTIHGLGIDTASLDNGQATHRKAHEALFGANIYGIESVANLHKLPTYGSTLYVFPMKISKASGAPTRIMAILPKRNQNSATVINT